MLSNLRAFKWSSLGLAAHHLPAFAYLLGSNVKQMFVSASDLGADSGHILTLFFAILARRISSLRYLGFYNLPNLYSNTPATSLALSYAVQGTTNLTSFNCAFIALSEDAVNTLASLPTLRFCSFRLPELNAWRSAHTISNAFPALVHIEITSSIEAYAAFSRAMALPFIQRLALAITTIPDSAALLNFLPSIRRQLSPSSLTSIQVYPFDGLKQRFDRTAIVAQEAVLRSIHFSPLLDFNLLESFDLRLPCLHDIDDSLFASLAKAWPHLRTFVLGDQPYCIHDTPRTTLKALIPFALHCPRLEALGLQLDATAAQSTGHVPPEYYDELRALPHGSPSRVELLHVSSSPVAHAEEVALFFSTVFPELRIVWASRSDKTREGQKRRKAWQRVDKLVRMMHSVRVDERKRWQADARMIAPAKESEGDGESGGEDPALPVVVTTELPLRC
ncbi:hypothetical protein C8Q76DRAFT_676870 [Earliella scabrosa]|nr:hypothetical protein C8Q76DRAFT_676870 [Earliella scabrosa]